MAAQKGYTKEDYIKAYHQAGTASGAARLLGTNEAATCRRIKQLRESGELEGLQITPTVSQSNFQVNGNDKQVTIISNSSDVRTIDQAIDKAGVDLTTYEIDKQNIKHYQQTSKDDDGNITVSDMVSMSVTLKKRKDAYIYQALDDMVRGIKSPKFKPVKYKKAKNPILAVPCIFDLHLEKLCWKGEVLHNYDTKISSHEFNKCLDYFIARMQGVEVDRILWIAGNDFYHTDTPNGTTAAGTVLDHDSRWRKVFRVGCELQIEAIERMAKIAPVDVMIVAGNHDMTRAFYMGEVLRVHFQNHGSVTVDNSGHDRKYFQYGQNLLMGTHGQHIKDKDLPMKMAVEQSKAWGDTLHRYALTGHLHTAKQMALQIGQDHQSVQVFRVPSLCASDEWHHVHGYNSKRAAQCFLFDKKSGLTDQMWYNV